MKNLISKMLIAGSLVLGLGFIACDNKNTNDDNELPTETLGTQDGEKQRLGGTDGSDGIDNDDMSTGSGTGTNPANNAESGRNSGGQVADSAGYNNNSVSDTSANTTGSPQR